MTLWDYTMRLLCRDLDRPWMREWLGALADQAVRPEIDIVAVQDEVRNDA